MEKLFIEKTSTLIDALQKMDSIGKKLLIVVENDKKYLTLLSIGDIQRAIIRGSELTSLISNISIENKVIAHKKDTTVSVIELMRHLRAEYMPIIDDERNILNVIYWSEISKSTRIKESKKINIPVVIMAGGKGTRLKPLSNIIPKPLIPIGEKTIIEEIIERFNQAGSEEFYISVNYKKDMIQYYLNSLEMPYQIDYFEEQQPLGTAGSLNLLKGKIDKTFYVTNCDILIDQDLSELYDYHKSNNNEITLVSVIKTLSIPYGTIQSGKAGILESMEEKPKLSFKINAGIYVLEPHLIDEIPKNKFFHITSLIDQIIKRGGQVGVFPISEKSWFDIGEWPEYVKTVRSLSDQEQFRGIQ